MRIIGNIEHPTLKISIFKNDDRYSIKFETALYEQTIKLKDQLASLEEIKQFVDDQLILDIENNFTKMHQSSLAAFQRFEPQTIEDKFEEII